MNSNNAPERFPILTIFCLMIFLAWQALLAAFYLWVVGEPAAPVISLCLARLFAFAGLPPNSLIPILVEGRTYTASQWLQAAATPAGLSTLRASNWLLFYLPPVSFFLTFVSMLSTKKWTNRGSPKLVRGVKVVKR